MYITCLISSWKHMLYIACSFCTSSSRLCIYMYHDRERECHWQGGCQLAQCDLLTSVGPWRWEAVISFGMPALSSIWSIVCYGKGRRERGGGRGEENEEEEEEEISLYLECDHLMPSSWFPSEKDWYIQYTSWVCGS